MDNRDIGGRGCIQLLSLLAFIWGAAMMFPRTVDLLSNFSPNTFLGYTGLAGYWAMGSALLIEGVMVLMKLKTWITPAKNLVEWLGDVLLTVTPFILSSLAQVFDGMIVRETLTQQPAEIQLLVTWLVPSLPAMMIGLLIAFALVESAPPGLFGGIGVGNRSTFSFPKVSLPEWMKPSNWFNRRVSDTANTQAEKRPNPTPLPTPKDPHP